MNLSAFPKRPVIRKLGTIECNNIVETTPLVYRGELYRFEVVRRKSFAAAMAGMIEAQVIDKIDGGYIGMGLFICYGAGQL